MKTKYMAVAMTATVASLGLVLSGCGSTPAASGPITMEFWGWAPGYQQAVDLWNSKNPDQKVEFKSTPTSNKIYPKVLTAVKAGNAPCLQQVGYEALPAFLVDDALVDLKEYVKNVGQDFTAAGAKSVELGGGVYGVPVDTAPMTMIYNKEALDKYGITVPTTWPEYAAAAKKVKAANPKVSLGYFSNDSNFFAGLARQAGGRWYNVSKDSVKVNFSDPQTSKVAAFWQGMIDEGTIPVHEGYTPALYKQLSEGTILSETYGIWDTKLIEKTLADQKGKWRVAPMPNWPDRPGGADMGGSSTAVLKGCKYPKQAAEFATWMSTNPEAVNLLVDQGGLWPAAVSGLDTPALGKPSEFYGNEKIFEPFKKIAKEMPYEWEWSPTHTQASADLESTLVKVTKDFPISTVLREVQDKAVAELKKKGIQVSS